MTWSRLFDPWAGDVFGDLDQLRREMNSMLNRFAAPHAARGVPYPPVNLYEDADGYVLTAELPGVKREDLDVSVEGNQVTLRGQRQIEYPADDRTSLHRRERQAGIFRRTVELPVPADAGKAEALYRNGVLMLRIPKAPEHQPRRIQVRAS